MRNERIVSLGDRQLQATKQIGYCITTNVKKACEHSRMFMLNASELSKTKHI